MYRNRLILIFLFFSLLLSSCGTTTIFVSNSNVDLYVNSVYKGKGHAEVKRTGVPKKMKIEAKYQGSTFGELVVKRKFDAVTFLSCYFTYGIGLLFSFRYPANIVVPISIDSNDPNQNKNPNQSRQSIWMRPPGNWK